MKARDGNGEPFFRAIHWLLVGASRNLSFYLVIGILKLDDVALHD
jgi:hypothetical protein